MQENKNTDIENILKKIKSGEVKMTSKQFFIMKMSTLFITSVFFLILAFYIFAYITFLFVDNGLLYMPVFTQAGLINFIIEIPWTLVFLGLLSIFLFSITSKTFYRIYRKPFLTFFFTILIIIMLSHVIFVETGTMKLLKQEAYEMHFQLVPEKFLQFRDSQTGTISVGRIMATTTNSVIILNHKNETVEIFIENPLDLKTFILGNIINAYVERIDGKLYAKSIEIVE